MSSPALESAVPVTAVTTTSAPVSPPAPSTQTSASANAPDLVAMAQAMEKAWQARRRPQQTGPLHRV